MQSTITHRCKCTKESKSTPRNRHQIISAIAKYPSVPNVESELNAGMKIDIEEEGWCLGDGDLARLALLVLGDDNAEQTILHACSDVVLVDTGREGEGAREFSDTAFRDPKLGLRLLGLSRLILLGDLGGSAFSTLVLDGGLVSLVSVGSLDGTLGWSTLDETSGWSARGVASLGTAFDGQRVGVGEFDLDILLLDTGKLAVEVVSVLVFLDVELGGEGLQGGGNVTVALTVAAVLIEVIKETKEWLEGVGWVGCEE